MSFNLTKQSDMAKANRVELETSEEIAIATQLEQSFIERGISGVIAESFKLINALYEADKQPYEYDEAAGELTMTAQAICRKQENKFMQASKECCDEQAELDERLTETLQRFNLDQFQREELYTLIDEMIGAAMRFSHVDTLK